MYTTHDLCCEFLQCGRFDLQSVIELIQKYNFLDIGDVIEEAKNLFWELNHINIIIYMIYGMAVQEFISHNRLTLEDGVDYEIRTNYMDNSLHFMNAKVQNKFDRWLKWKTHI